MKATAFLSRRLSLLFFLPVLVCTVTTNAADFPNPSGKSTLFKVLPFSCALIISESKSTKTYRHQCSGVRVSATKFVTGAHCFDNPEIRKQMKSGDLFVSCPGEDRLTVRESLISPRYEGCAGATTYDADYPNDVAVVLTEPSNQRQFPTLVKDVSAFVELAKFNACGFVGYGPAICDAKSKAFPRGCLRDVDMRKLKNPTGSYFSTEADIREGDSGSGLVCFDEAKNPWLVGTNVGSIYTGKPNMQSMSIAKQISFLERALKIPDATFIREAAAVARNHAKTCHD